jgi:2-dehydropantoate 2-reductase
MKMAVIGAGAMGGALAAEAALAGHDVHVLDVSAELVTAVRERGIAVTVDGAEVTGKVQASTDPASIGPAELVVIFVKAQHTAAAAASIAALRGPGTVVASLQNGWGNADVLAREAGTEGLVFGVTYNSCSSAGLARVRHTGRGETVIGSYAGDAAGTAAAERAAQALTSAGWACRVTPEVRTEIWKKLILNAATLPTAALTGLAAGELAAAPAMSDLVDATAQEACAVARGLGLGIDPAERLEAIHRVLAAAGPGKASMLQDAEARRKTEVEVINGAVVREADRLGIDVPVNRALAALISGLERSWSL